VIVRVSAQMRLETIPLIINGFQLHSELSNFEDGCGISNSEMTGFDDDTARAMGHVIVEDARMLYEVVKRRRERERE